MEKVTLVIEGLLVELKIPPPSLQTELLLNVTEVRVGLLPSVLCIAMLGSKNRIFLHANWVD